MAGTRSLALTALLAAALLAGCGGDETTTVVNETTVTEGSTTESTATSTESTTTTPAPERLTAFQSPTGNIGCVMTAELARCDIAERDWKPPNRPTACPLDFGQGIELRPSGTAQFVCAGDTTLNPQAPKLEYGSSSRVGSITCTSSESGVSCTNESGGSFSISRQSYDLG